MRYGQFAAVCLILSSSALPLPCSAQQSRLTPGETAQATDSTKLSFESKPWHFEGKHLRSSSESSRGTRLLVRPSLRDSLLQTRLRATANLPSQSSSATIFPGMQFRDALPAGITPTSAATGDFNRDGHKDFVIANGFTDELWIYFGNGDGTFALPRVIPLSKGLYPIYLAAADLRGIGILDLIVAEVGTSSIGVLLGNGDGTFGYEQIHPLPEAPAALVVDDFNHDGKLDVVGVMTMTDGNDFFGPWLIATLFGDGMGGFSGGNLTSSRFAAQPWNVASGDVNKDGLPDLIVTSTDSGVGSSVYLNNGDGSFTFGQRVVERGKYNIPLDARFGDINEDGCLDAVVGDINGDAWVSLGDCGGHFGPISSVQMGDSNASLRLADINGDGHLDIVTAAIAVGGVQGDVAGNTLSVAFGDGRGHFTLGRDYVGTGQSYSLAIADFNGDGKPDVVTAGTDTDTATVYINDGSGGFGFPQGLFVGLPGVGVLNAPISSPSFADLNGDGKPDILLLDEGYFGEYFVASFLNDGTGRFAGPVVSDTGIAITSNWMGDYRLGDFRSTGRIDFVGIGLTSIASSAASYILFMPGNGDGSFGKATMVSTPGAQGSIAIGDFDGDGKLDFAAADAGKLTAFLGNGDGTFRSAGTVTYAGGANVGRVFAADFNRDGKPDVLVYDTGNGYWTTNTHVWEFLGNGDGSFQPPRQLFSPFQPMTVADMNKDHWPDIIRYDFFWPDGTSQTWGPARFTSYLGQPDGSFSQSSSYAPYAGTPVKVQPYMQSGDPTATSLVTDLNGDGYPDEIAFQYASRAGINAPVFAQILTNNVDGTLTPTYDVFPFYKAAYPKYAHDLDGDGRSDMLELDGATSSMHVFKGASSPSLQLVLADEQVRGSTGCGWVFPNVASSSDRAVTLASDVAGMIVPSSITITANSLLQRFCYSLAPTFDWHRVFNIRAQLGTDVAVAYASQSYVLGFSEALSPNTKQVIYAGQDTAPVTITLTAVPGYSSKPELHCEGLPALASCSFGSDRLTVSPSASASTTVVVHTVAGTGGGLAPPITIVADDGNVIRRQSFELTLVNLFANTSGFLQAPPGGVATASVSVGGVPPYILSCTGLPSGATCTFSGTQYPYPGTSIINLSVSVPASMAAGTYPFQVVVAGGPQVVSSTATLTVTTARFMPQNGWWVDPNLGGVGFFIEYGGTSGNGLFVAAFTYDAAGNAMWLVSTGQMSGSTYNGTWQKATGGQTLLGPMKGPPTLTNAGNLGITFSDSSHAVLTRPDGTKINLQRFSFTASTTPAAPESGTPQIGWWYAGVNNGAAYGIEAQNDSVFIVAYAYDDAGNPVWYLATGNLTTPTTYSGSWDVYAGGAQLTAPEGTPGAHKVSTATPMSLVFSDATHGTLTMGSVVIPITRFQAF